MGIVYSYFRRPSSERIPFINHRAIASWEKEQRSFEMTVILNTNIPCERMEDVRTLRISLQNIEKEDDIQAYEKAKHLEKELYKLTPKYTTGGLKIKTTPEKTVSFSDLVELSLYSPVSMRTESAPMF